MKTKRKSSRRKPPMLVNAEHMAQQNPETFEIPKSRSSLRVGDFAKVCCEGERFWCEITGVKNGIYDATVANDLLMAPLRHGEKIQFLPCNVYSCMRGNESLD